MPGKQAWRVEQYEIFIEGTARYVEAKFLIAADGDFEALSGDPSFKNFASSKGKSLLNCLAWEALGRDTFILWVCILAF